MIDREKLHSLSGDELEQYLDEIIAYNDAKLEYYQRLLEQLRKTIDADRGITSND